MKSTAIVCAIAAASLGFASLSFAQGYDGRGPRGEPPRVEHRGPAGHGPGYRAVDDHRRGVEHRYIRDDRNDRHFNGHGRQFYRGGHIPNEYRGRQYVVNDWRGRHLHAPPRGQQWVQVGTDYALIAIATGVIAQLVLSN
ncbi:RcnB family protein [Polaromonas sp. LjRoot131]|uniref:RcnB family protein n=1 Tax=Polaromonas sp. LjRoot131 TaxID=3342262 RepID=UPI003ECF2D56